jgi:coenzyme F420 biosynthesis associated uncharacterized protein
VTTPVDWDFAQRVAERFSRREQVADAYHHETLVADFHELTAQAEQLVAVETGLVSSAGPARARVADRSMWIGANIASFQRLLRPLTDKMAEKFDKKGALAGLTRRAGGAEVGIVLGWMSTRVLGQYDLLIIEEERPDDQDIVYYVGPNILALERKHGFPPREFRLWLALHETTHRAQFTGVPWLREHFLSLVEETLDEIDPDPQRLLEAAKKILEARRRGEDALDGGIAVLLATERQREVLDRISGMMSLLEGHGDVTMDRAGEGRVPNAERFASVLRRRRNSARGVSRLFQKLIGIEAKLNQYAAGEAFIAAVEEAGGPELLNRAWEGPENLPSMSEIREPALWIERICTGADPAVLAG